jgi:hypothetical protein
MNCRRWCFGVTVVVVAIGTGGIPAVAQQSPPAIEVPAVTVPAVTLPVPPGGPEIATPPISTPPVRTPAIETPVGTVPSVTVPPLKVDSVTVPSVKTAPAPSGEEPAAGGGGTAKPTASNPPSAGASSAQPAPRATPALVAVRGTATRRSEGAARAATRTHATEGRAPSRRTRSPEHRATSAAHHVAPRLDRDAAPAIAVLDDRAARAPVPVAHSVRQERDARPLVDALGPALDVAPLLMALALGGALCAVSRQMRRVG